jgi:hypothetical protein
MMADIKSSKNPHHHSESSGQDLEQRNQEEKGHGYESAEAETLQRQYVTGISRWLILGPITLTYFTFFLDLAVLSTATPAITSEFNSLVDIGWYSLIYLCLTGPPC